VIGEPRVLSYDPDTGIRELFYYDPDTDQSTIITEQDVSAIAERNKAIYNRVDERAGWKGDLHWVGSIPLVIFFRLVQQGIVNWGGDILDQERLNRWLNDNSNIAWRTRPGTV
jgi:hypothetical protein